ncbi:MAG: decaprenyl-phosphate phosphoribosyltransferase [Armatimonadetes bacterium]|nr:decaprenyl-phosphate phosphoribosyltransferase [Armatimonadota bacterium]
MRPRQWSKNLLLFAGLVFTGNILNAPLLVRSIAGFACFCLLSGALYIVNDILDAPRDRLHPLKRLRPVAAETLPVGTAWFGAATIGAAALAGCFAMGALPGLIALAYALLSLAYTLWLKHVVLVDVFVIAFGFVLRAIAGAVMISVKISAWLLLCTTLLALFLGLAKRRQEIVLLSEDAAGHRRILEEYSLAWIDQMLSAITAATIVSYALYTFNSETASQHPLLMATTPFVMYGLFRYLYLMHRKSMGGSPEAALLEDRPLQINILLWIAVSALILYFNHP